MFILYVCVRVYVYIASNFDYIKKLWIICALQNQLINYKWKMCV